MEMSTVNCEKHTQYLNTLCEQNAEFWAVECVVHIVTTSYVEYSRTRQADSLSDCQRILFL
jgi:hypothetical protein